MLSDVDWILFIASSIDRLKSDRFCSQDLPRPLSGAQLSSTQVAASSWQYCGSGATWSIGSASQCCTTGCCTGLGTTTGTSSCSQYNGSCPTGVCCTCGVGCGCWVKSSRNLVKFSRNLVHCAAWLTSDWASQHSHSDVLLGLVMQSATIDSRHWGLA